MWVVCSWRLAVWSDQQTSYKEAITYCHGFGGDVFEAQLSLCMCMFAGAVHGQAGCKVTLAFVFCVLAIQESHMAFRKRVCA